VRHHRRRRQPISTSRRARGLFDWAPPSWAVEAIKAQADRLIHIAATDFYEPRYLELTEHWRASCPSRSARGLLTNSGTEAVEAPSSWLATTPIARG
jgi:hypothetical protein